MPAGNLLLFHHKKRVYVSKKHIRRKIFKKLENVSNLENYYEGVIQISVLLYNFHNSDTNIEFIDYDIIEKFIEKKKKNEKLFQTISFVYVKVIEFPENQFAVTNIVTKNFFLNVSNLMYRKIHLHQSHVTGEFKRCVHNLFSLLKELGWVWRTKNLSIVG